MCDDNTATRSNNSHLEEKHIPSLFIVQQLLWSLRNTLIRKSVLPPYPYRCVGPMAAANPQPRPIPGTPRVISPSPTPSDNKERRDGYFGPITRSVTRNRVKSPPLIDEEKERDYTSDSSVESDRARTRSRSPITAGRRRRSRRSSSSTSLVSGLTARPKPLGKKKDTPSVIPNGHASNGHLSPSSAGSSYWRDLSRSPSPLGLIPIHRHWRSVVCHIFPPERFLPPYADD